MKYNESAAYCFDYAKGKLVKFKNQWSISLMSSF